MAHPLFAELYRRCNHGQSPREHNACIFHVHDLECDPDAMVNTGVLVVPRESTQALEATYHKYQTKMLQQQEQAYLSFELAQRGLTHLIDPKFNAVWYEYKYGVYFGDTDIAGTRRLFL